MSVTSSSTGCAEDRIGKIAGRRQRLELVAEVGAEEVVHDREHLRPRAVVHRQRQHASPACARRSRKTCDVRVAEAVDRLELVADEEELVTAGPPESRSISSHCSAFVSWNSSTMIDAEAQLLALADRRRRRARDRARAAADPRSRAPTRAPCPACVRGGKARPAAPAADRGRPRRARRAPPAPPPCAPLRTGARARRAGEGRRDRRSDRARASASSTRRPAGPSRVARRRPRRRRGSWRLRETRRRDRETRALAQLEDERAARRAERLVDAGEHPPQPVRPIDGEEPQPRGIVCRAESGQRLRESLAAEHAALAVVQHAKAWVDPGGERMRTQQPVTEAVDRGDPRPVELAREVRTSTLDESRTDPAAQLAGRLLRVGDHEDRFDVDALVADGTRETFHEHLRLACTGSGRDEDEPARVDCALLFRVELHARLTRHIDQSSHQVGQSPLFGSCLTSPVRIRSTMSTASSRARST